MLQQVTGISLSASGESRNSYTTQPCSAAPAQLIRTARRAAAGDSPSTPISSTVSGDPDISDFRFQISIWGGVGIADWIADRRLDCRLIRINEIGNLESAI
jgi:hypothetical protein